MKDNGKEILINNCSDPHEIHSNHCAVQGEGLFKDGDGEEAVSVFRDPLRQSPCWEQKV